MYIYMYVYGIFMNGSGGDYAWTQTPAFGLLATPGTVGAGAVLVLSAQALWCELYDMNN